VNLPSANFTGARYSAASAQLPFDLQMILRDHALWADSAGQRGVRALLRGVDLRGMNLAFAYLNGADLLGADLRGCTLSDSEFILANLMEARLDKANLRKADFSGACLRAANLTGACLERARFAVVEVKDANGQLTGRSRATDLRGADLTDADLSQTDLSAAIPVDAAPEPETDDVPRH